MKVLVVTQRKLLPMTDGALIGSMGLLNYLHDLGHEVQVVHFVEDEEYTAEELKELKNIVEDVHTVKLHWRSTALNMSFKYPNSIRKYKRSAMTRKVKSIIEEFKPDFGVIDHTQMYEYASCFKNMYYVLHTHNVESNVWFDYAKKKNGLVKLLVTRTAKMMRDYEIKALKESPSVTACSETDTEIFKQLVPTANVATFHSYLKFPVVKTKEDIMQVSNSIVYIGSYSWYPNQIAAKFLITELMPKLREVIPGIKLYLVGKDPTEEIKTEGLKYSDIEVTGMVESVDPYIKKADVFVNAVEYGGGINIKLIETMGKGIPIVSSTFGVRGTNIKNEKEVCIYDSLSSCVSYIAKIIKNKEFAIDLSNNSRNYYLEFIRPSNRIFEIFNGDVGGL